MLHLSTGNDIIVAHVRAPPPAPPPWHRTLTFTLLTYSIICSINSIDSVYSMEFNSNKVKWIATTNTWTCSNISSTLVVYYFSSLYQKWLIILCIHSKPRGGLRMVTFEHSVLSVWMLWQNWKLQHDWVMHTEKLKISIFRKKYQKGILLVCPNRIKLV